ncbi:MAG: transketolase C-terminal domain-containing protein [Pseudomonadota bacterium]
MSQNSTMLAYGDAIRQGFCYLFDNDPSVFAIGQGLWSPWYVGNTMLDLDKLYGKARVIDTPVSEAACTGAAIGASLFGKRAVAIHPRMDFMILAADQMVNQAAKWSYMLGGQASPAVTIRGIVNRGGEQGAQHSQALHSWYAHIPGLRVVMPATPTDARDLLISSVLCDDPVLYIDDRWLYDVAEQDRDVDLQPLETVTPKLRRNGGDITLVAASYSVQLCLEAAGLLEKEGIECGVIDLRVLNPMDSQLITSEVSRSGRLLAVDGGWSTCGLAGEVIATAAERVLPRQWKAAPVRVTLPDSPAPTSGSLERLYYPTVESVCVAARNMM